MPQDHGPGLLPGQFLELRRYRFADTAEPFDPAGLSHLDANFAPNRLGTFRDHNDGIRLPFRATVQQVRGHLVDRIRNLRNENGIGATRHAGVKRNPAYVPPHYLYDNYALVRTRRGVQTIDAVSSKRNRRVEAERHRRRLKIVINGLGNAHYLQAFLLKLVSD